MYKRILLTAPVNRKMRMYLWRWVTVCFIIMWIMGSQNEDNLGVLFNVVGACFLFPSFVLAFTPKQKDVHWVVSELDVEFDDKKFDVSSIREIDISVGNSVKESFFMFQMPEQEARSYVLLIMNDSQEFYFDFLPLNDSINEKVIDFVNCVKSVKS